jgi:hypothetical protein
MEKTGIAQAGSDFPAPKTGCGGQRAAAAL